MLSVNATVLICRAVDCYKVVLNSSDNILFVGGNGGGYIN